MKQFSLVCLLAVSWLFSGAADTTGIQFEHAAWKAITARAKKENKLIFIDCYTSWCGPCKKMAATVFTQKQVGELFNQHFISCKIDMEAGEGKDLSKAFHVGAYPTMLWVNAAGTVVHRVLGFMEADKLMTEAGAALRGGNAGAAQSLEEDYIKNKNNAEVVEAYLKSLIRTSDSRVREVSLQYLAVIPQERYLENEVYRLIGSHVISPFSPVVTYIEEHRAAFDAKYKAKEVDKMLSDKYERYGHSLAWEVKSGKAFDEAAFQKLVARMEERSFEGRQEVIAFTRIKTLQYQGNWQAYTATIDSLLSAGFYKTLTTKSYGDWYKPVVESNCNNQAVLASAFRWTNCAFEVTESFSMSYFQQLWRAKIDLLKRMQGKAAEVAVAETELALFTKLESKQIVANMAQMKRTQELQVLLQAAKAKEAN